MSEPSSVERARAFMAQLVDRGASDAECETAWRTYLRENHGLAVAIENDDDDEVRALLAAGASPESTDVLGSPCLHGAAALGRLSAARALVEAGARVDQRDGYASIALWHAANGGHLEMVRALLAWGADPTLVGDGGCAPIGRARDPVMIAELEAAMVSSSRSRRS